MKTSGKVNLDGLIEVFYDHKKELDKYKKTTDEYNKQIKSELNKLGTTEFVTESGLVAKLAIQNRESFNEDLLIAKLKELQVNEVIKTKEYVDMDALEDAIYNGKLNASELSNCKIIKTIETLRVLDKPNHGNDQDQRIKQSLPETEGSFQVFLQSIMRSG